MKNSRAFKLALEAYNCGLVEGEKQGTNTVNTSQYTKVMYLRLADEARKYRAALEVLAHCNRIPEEEAAIITEALRHEEGIRGVS